MIRALAREGVIAAAPEAFDISAVEDAARQVSFTLTGGERRDRAVILRALQEVLEPVQNPRYLLLRNPKRFGFLRRPDLIAVPRALGNHRRQAETFLECWRSLIGPAELVYTRDEQGRRALLLARSRSLAAGLADRTDIRESWS